MNRAWYQVWGMMRYEVLMMWRRGSLRIILVGLIALPVLYILSSAESYHDAMNSYNPPEFAAFSVRTVGMILSSVPALATILVGVPILISELIPFDRQYGVDSLLRPLPLTLRLYLGGKMLAAWAGLGLVTVVAAVVIGVVGWLLFGSFDLGIWLLLWGLGLLLFMFYAGGISVLLAATQPNRRRAVFVGLALVPYLLAAYIRAPAGIFQMDMVERSLKNIQAFSEMAASEMPPVLTVEALAWGVFTLLLAGAVGWFHLQRES